MSVERHYKTRIGIVPRNSGAGGGNENEHSTFDIQRSSSNRGEVGRVTPRAPQPSPAAEAELLTIQDNLLPAPPQDEKMENWEHPTSNVEHGTSNAPGSAGVPPASRETRQRDTDVPEDTQSEGHQNHQTPIAPGSVETVQRDAGAPGESRFPQENVPEIGNGKHRTSNIERRTSNETRTPVGANSAAASGMTNAPSLSALRVPSSAFASAFVTRDELQRELDSLRRLMESRK